MICPAGGPPYPERSSVVCASLTRVTSYPRTKAPWIVARMHASVCAPATTPFQGGHEAVIGTLASVV